MGIVDSHPSGRSRIYWLDRDNAYVQRIVDVAFEAQDAMPDDLGVDLKRLFGDLCSSVVLFGSYARGSQTPRSDVDVVLVLADAARMKDLDDRIADEMIGFRHRWGAPLSAISYTQERAAALSEQSPGLYGDIEKEGITISGDPPWSWGRHGGERSDPEGGSA
jgi:hypothetical protein